MNNIKPVDQVVQEANAHFYKLFVFGPFFFLNLFLWNSLSYFALASGIVDGWSHLIFLVVGACSMVHLSVRADQEYFIEKFLKKEGYNVDTISWVCKDE